MSDRTLLQEGDIIELQPGMVVYATLPYHCVYENAFGNFAELASTEVTIGGVRHGLDTTFLVGRYVVVNAMKRGGGTGMGWHVTAQRLMPVTASMSGRSMSKDHPLRVSFYQTGSFTAMIPNIEPVGRAKAEWSEA